jgi:RHS repeat-associated protein
MFDNLIGRAVTTYTNGSPTGTTTARYVFDGTNMVLAFDGSTDNLTDRYLWGPAVDQVLADEHFSLSGSNQLPMSASGTTLWALGDNQNSVRDVVTDTGALEQHIAYSPFGQQVSGTGLTTTGSVVPNFAFGYTGTYTDPATTLQLHGLRWYNPSSQRWLTQDPSGLGPDSNRYRYCGNAPTSWVDPSGLARDILWPIANGAITAAVRAGNSGRYPNFFYNAWISTIVTKLNGNLAAVPANQQSQKPDIAMFPRNPNCVAVLSQTPIVMSGFYSGPVYEIKPKGDDPIAAANQLAKYVALLNLAGIRAYAGAGDPGTSGTVQTIVGQLDWWEAGGIIWYQWGTKPKSQPAPAAPPPPRTWWQWYKYKVMPNIMILID